MAPAGDNNPPTPWAKSKAKKLLHDDIVSKKNETFRGPKGIYNSRPEYKRYNFKNFCSNYYSLRRAIQARLELKAKARAAYEHDKHFIDQQRGSSFYYDASTLQRQLRRDVQLGFTDGRTPSEVLGSRRVFRESGLAPKEFSNFLSYERKRHERMLHEEDYRERMRFVNAEINPDA